MQTFNKMKNIASKVPTSAGSLVVWQSKTNVTSGHIGVLVHNISEREIITLEGNTDADGTREGDGIYLKKRAFNSIGMNFKGFVPCASNAEFEAYIRESINLNDGTWQ